MRLFKFSCKFEQDGRWSDRKADTEGYFIKRNDDDDAVEGYVKMLYPTCSDSVRYIKGLYSGSSLIFMQLSNDFILSPICYCFPDVKKEGYWSDYVGRCGFFPVIPSYPCSRGHATVIIEEITDGTLTEIEMEVSATFEENSRKASWSNQWLLRDFRALADFLDSGIIFQMKLHCGKW